MAEPTYEVTEDSLGDWHRNIVSLRTAVSLFEDLVDEPGQTQVLIEHEIATKPTVAPLPIINRPFEDVEVYDPIRLAITWPFEHPMASRYSDGTFGVWYGADSLKTSIYETVHHFRRNTLASEIAAKSVRPIVQHRRVHKIHCNAMLVDLRPLCAKDRHLLDPIDYASAQVLGTKLHAASLPGLLAPSARHESGLVAAIFTPKALSDPRDVCFLTYSLDTQSQRVDVKRNPGKTEFRLDS
jgi:RES domain